MLCKQSLCGLSYCHMMNLSLLSTYVKLLPALEVLAIDGLISDLPFLYKVQPIFSTTFEVVSVLVLIGLSAAFDTIDHRPSHPITET